MSRLNNYLNKYANKKLNSAAVAYLASLDQIETVSPDIAQNIVNELQDERSHLADIFDFKI